MKTNAWAVFLGAPEAWGPWARAQRAHWIRRPWLCKIARYCRILVHPG